MAVPAKDPLKVLKVILTEEDILGLKIPRETVEQCSVVQLKRWVLCRGGKTTGNKKELVTRYDSSKIRLRVKFFLSCLLFHVFVLFNW